MTCKCDGGGGSPPPVLRRRRQRISVGTAAAALTPPPLDERLKRIVACFRKPEVLNMVRRFGPLPTCRAWEIVSGRAVESYSFPRRLVAGATPYPWTLLFAPPYLNPVSGGVEGRWGASFSLAAYKTSGGAFLGGGPGDMVPDTVSAPTAAWLYVYDEILVSLVPYTQPGANGASWAGYTDPGGGDAYTAPPIAASAGLTYNGPPAMVTVNILMTNAFGRLCPDLDREASWTGLIAEPTVLRFRTFVPVVGAPSRCPLTIAGAGLGLASGATAPFIGATMFGPTAAQVAQPALAVSAWAGLSDEVASPHGCGFFDASLKVGAEPQGLVDAVNALSG